MCCSHWFRSQKEDEYSEVLEFPSEALGFRRHDIKSMVSAPLYFIDKVGRERTALLGDGLAAVGTLCQHYNIPYVNIAEWATRCAYPRRSRGGGGGGSGRGGRGRGGGGGGSHPSQQQ